VDLKRWSCEKPNTVRSVVNAGEKTIGDAVGLEFELSNCSFASRSAVVGGPNVAPPSVERRSPRPCTLTRTVPGELDGGDPATPRIAAVAGTGDGNETRVHATPWLVLRYRPLDVAASHVSLTPVRPTTASPLMTRRFVGVHVAPRSVLTYTPSLVHARMR
jgi:hypothetical protein